MKARLIDNRFICFIPDDFIQQNEGKIIEFPNLTLDNWDLVDELPTEEEQNYYKCMFNSITKTYYEGATEQEIEQMNTYIPLFELYSTITLEDVQNGKIQLDQLMGLTRLEPISDKGIKPARNYVRGNVLVWSIQDVDYISNTDNPKRTETIIKIYNNKNDVAFSWVSKIKLLRPEDISKELKIRRENIMNYLQGNAPSYYEFLFNIFRNEAEIWKELGGDILVNSLIDASQNHSDTLVITTLNAQATHSITGELMVKHDGTPLTNLEAILHELS